MKEYLTGQIRNIALVSHNGAGKTTFVERLLLQTGVITRMGSVQTGTAVMDFEEEEIARNSSISTAIAPIEWKNHKLNLLDTPGFVDFVGEVNSALHVADAALIFVEAVAGVEVGTEQVWRATGERKMPRMILINKMNRDNVRFERVLKNVQDHFHGHLVNLHLPIGEGATFKGVVDLFAMEARLGPNDERGPIPADMASAVKDARAALIEAAAEGDDELIEKFLDGKELTPQEIARGLKEATMAGLVVPIMYSAPEAGIAVLPVIESLINFFPAPSETANFKAILPNEQEVNHPIKDQSPLAAFVFKTREDPYGKMSYIRVYGGHLDSDSRVWASHLNAEVRVGALQIIRGKEQMSTPHLHAGDIGGVVKLGDAATNETLCSPQDKFILPSISQPTPLMSLAIQPIAQADVAKLSQSLHRLVSEDLTLHTHTETSTHQTILSGMGTIHLEIAVKKLNSKFGVHVKTSVPKIPYLETITKKNTADYTHKKQTGGAGQFGRVSLRVEPLAEQDKFEFASEIFGGAVSAPFVAATEKGCRQALESGALAGYPVTGVRVVIYDGKEHPVDSKEIAFQVAGREGFKLAVMGAGPVLLEPLYEMSVSVPTEHMGDVLGDMNTRRAKVVGMDQDGANSIVKVEVPLAEVQQYASDLRSMTQGRGVFTMKFSQYGRVPAHLLEELVAKLHKERETEHHIEH